MRSWGRTCEQRRREQLACAVRDALATGDDQKVARLLGRRARIIVDAGGGGMRCDGATTLGPTSLRSTAVRPTCGTDGEVRQGDGLQWEVRAVNGAPGLVVRARGIPLAVVVIDGRRGRVRDVWVVADPAKLTGW